MTVRSIRSRNNFASPRQRSRKGSEFKTLLRPAVPDSDRYVEVAERRIGHKRILGTKTHFIQTERRSCRRAQCQPLVSWAAEDPAWDLVVKPNAKL
jgi:hypothetical protein